MRISLKAAKYLKSLPKQQRKIISGKIDRFKTVTDSNIKKLSGYKNCYRMRVGEYRLILVQLNDGDFEIIDIGHRKEIYKSL